METFFSKERTKQISNAVLILLVIFCLFFFFKFVNEVKQSRYVGSQYGIQNSINVSGKGEVVAIPDVATFSFTVREEKATTEDAQVLVTEKMNKILASLKDSGIKESDIKTTSYNIYPQYDYNNIQCFSYPCPPSKQELRGYEVSHSVLIKARNTEKTGELLGLVGKYKVDYVSGISFSIDDKDALKAEARSLAIKDAAEKAEKLAKDLGVKLVRVVSFYENNYEPYHMESYARAMGGDAMNMAVTPSPEIPAGENKTISNVNITYEIR